MCFPPPGAVDWETERRNINMIAKSEYITVQSPGHALGHG